MKSKVICCMVLFLVAVLSPCGKAAIWNPDTDVVFNMNFEQNKLGSPGSPPETNDVGPSKLVGKAYDFNTTQSDPCNPFHMWNSQWNGDACAAKIGNYVGDFRKMCDFSIGKPNDACVMFPCDTAIFDLGGTGQVYTLKKTFAFWFWVEAPQNVLYGAFIRHANKDMTNYKDYWWEIRINEEKLQFYHKQSCLCMETKVKLPDLGVQKDTWHHAAVVYDRDNNGLASKIYIDGVKVDKIVTAYNAVAGSITSEEGDDPVKFGSGQEPGGGSEYDGMLDEFRIYNRVLIPSEVSILYQTDYKPHAFALKPYPNDSIVPVTTDLEWYPDPNATSQTLVFSTDSDLDPCLIFRDDGNDMNSKANSLIGGPLALNTTYYWAVDTNISGTINRGQVWKFTTEDGKAYDPIPENGTENVRGGNVNLQWKGCPSAESYDVYFSTDQTLVQNDDDDALLESGVTDTNLSAPATDYAQNYYWRVVSTLSEAADPAPKNPVDSNVWTFRTEPYAIVFNTDNNDVNYTYSGGIIHTVPGYTCQVLQPGGSWLTESNGVSDDNSEDDVNVIVFNFDSFVYNNRYGITVVPQYDAGTDLNNIAITPLAIHVVGDFNFDGRMDISGDDVILTGAESEVNAPARCGGHRGPRPTSSDGDIPPDHESGYYDGFVLNPAYSRVGEEPKEKPRWEVNSVDGVRMFGIGAGGVASYIGGGGGGYGGMGGISGRGFYYAQWVGGVTYGDKEVPMPFGGSAGGWGKDTTGTGGGAGGGGVEIVAGGNVILGPNAKILAKGSSIVVDNSYPGAGGSGGSVRIIADGNVLNRGIIDVNGGKGGNSTKQSNENGGGGGGGRVAIFYGGASCDANRITAKGGRRGIPTAATPDPCLTLAEDGEDGTIYVVKSSPARRTASAPTPKNNDRMVYCPNSTSGNRLTLKWYSGYNSTEANDIVYFRQGSPPTDNIIYQVGAPVRATRGQHTSSPNDVNIVPNQTYYWKVRTDPNAGIGDVNDANTVVWSFRTVNWICRYPHNTRDANQVPDPTPPGLDDPNHYYPIWDSYPPDCVVNMTDLPFFAKHWREYRGHGDGREFTVDGFDLNQFTQLWMECRGRTKDGCDTPVDW